MSDVKYSAGEEVSYRSKRPAGIDMKVTTMVGFHDQKKNPFQMVYSEVAGRPVPTRVPEDKQKVENRYIINHYFGWYPHIQANLETDVILRPNTRYYFAYESELSPIKGEQKV